jgi:cytochrome c553
MNIRLIASAVLFLAAAVVFKIAFATPTPVVPTAPQVDINWEKMDHDAREEFMRNVVMPKMRKVFHDFDSVKYAKINCKTCHGAGATNETFKMPNPKLPKLPSKPEGWTELNTKHPEIMKFMMQTVKPEMAKMLNVPQKDEKNPKGFGCTNCHTM